MTVLDRFRLDGKLLFITGGSRGLGREMALAIAEAGANVVLVGRDEASLQKTASEIRERGRAAHPITADVGLPAEMERVCAAVLKEHGTCDIVINNIGGRRINVPTEDLTLEQWQQILDLNLTSTFLSTKILGGAMIKRNTGGRIINMASISGLVANRGIGGRSYETSKAAVIAFTRATAADWAPHRITVNAIAPGGFFTEPNQRWQREHPEVISAFLNQIPMGEFGAPEDMGPLAVFLASDAARYITGATILIDGGYTLW